MSNVLNAVDGLDIDKLVSIIKDDVTGEEKKYMPVPNRVLWFRTANPLGKIVTNILEKNDSFAIVEARVYLSKDDDDKNYIAKGIAQRHYSNNSIYSTRNIEWAETAAIGRALSLAGYGTQFCSDELGDNGPVDSPVNVSDNKNTNTTTANKGSVSDKTTQTKVEAKAEVPKTVSEENKTDTKTKVVQTEQKETVAEVPKTETPKTEVSKTEAPKEEVKEQSKVESVKAEDNSVKEETVSETKETTLEQTSMESSTEVVAEEQTSLIEPSYTKLTPVDEILSLMSIEEAENTILDIGPLKGNTMKFLLGEDEQKVRWIVNSYAGNNNILKAAAKILISNLETQKAS